MSDSIGATPLVKQTIKRHTPRVDFLLLTANDAEARAVAELFQLEYEGDEQDKVQFKWGVIPTLDGDRQAIIGVIWLCDDLGVTPAYSMTKKALELLHPSYLIVLGIAAGVSTYNEPRKLGDLVYGSLVRTGSIKGMKLRERPIYQPSCSLFEAAELTRQRDSWRGSLDMTKRPGEKTEIGQQDIALRPNAWAGEVASADTFVTPGQGYVRTYVELYPKLAAFDMEVGGVGRFLREFSEMEQAPPYLLVKGISDLVYDQSKLEEYEDKSPAEVAEANKDEREKWKPFASHAATAFVKQLIREFNPPINRPAHPNMLWPSSRRGQVAVNSGCIGVYAAVEAEAYSALAAELLKHVVGAAGVDIEPANHYKHFFTVCAYSPRALWNTIVQTAIRRGENPTTIKQVYGAALDYFPHFHTFIEHVRAHPKSGVRILLLEDFNTWLPQKPEDCDGSSCTLSEHWKLFLLLNGYDMDGGGVGIPFWGIDRESLRRQGNAMRQYRFLTDYVILSNEFVLDYYDESGILIASEAARNEPRLKGYLLELRDLFFDKHLKDGPFKNQGELQRLAIAAFRPRRRAKGKTR